MTICKDCYIPMASIMSFSKNKHEKFCHCPKCRGETKHQKLKDEELDFGEVLHREINNK